VEFYAAARKRLRPGGILAQWMPGGDREDFAAVARSLRNSFPYVRVFREGDNWGFHFLASEQSLSQRTAEELLRRTPADAVRDLTEWSRPTGGQSEALLTFDNLLKNETPIETIIAVSPDTPPLSDDRPINEYFALRRANRR